MVKRIEKEVSIVLDDGKIPLLLGGEHTISVGAISALSKRNKNFSVLQFDAHSDTRDEYMGTKYCHACVMARAKELCKSCYGVGIRSVDEQSMKDKGIMMFRNDMHKLTAKQIVDKIIKSTEKNIYLTIDLDVLDPSEMPSTGTPEPDGLYYRDLKKILELVLKEKKVIGVDLVELNPIPGLVAPNYLAAKLIYSTIGFVYNR
jgi:agmatinase